MLKTFFVRLGMLAFVGAFVALIAIVAVYVIDDVSDDTTTQTVAPGVVTESEALDAPVGIPSDAEPATVNYVHDGDTIFLNTPADPNLKVRLLAVDTPEIGDNLECYGNEATDFTRSLLPEGSTAYTLADTEPYDQYGRALLFVWTAGGELINYSLVADGYAEAVFIGSNRMFEYEVEEAEDDAQAKGLGFWGTC